MTQQREGEEAPSEGKSLTGLLEGDISITVKVSDGKTSGVWTLPKDLLTHASPFFDAALNRPWTESLSKIVDLKEVRPAVFRFFVHWLYAWVNSKDGIYPRHITLAGQTTVLHAWFLGDKLGCPRFQDYALLHLEESLVQNQCKDFATVIREAYANTPPSSKLRVFIASIMLSGTTVHKTPFKRQGWWVDVVDEVEDLAKDIVKLQMFSAKPFVYGDNWASYLLVSSRDDYELWD
ncbi:MAG: hypothetical protein Q9173_007129 [Seirophora scorigena]